MAGQNLVTGKSTSGGTVTVYWYGTTTKPTINVSDGGASKSNPITADADGSYAFWIDDGHYNIINGTPTGNLEIRPRQAANNSAIEANKVILTPFMGNTSILNLEQLSEALMAGTTTQAGGTFTGAVTISDTTEATSSTTGALIVSGGLGLAKSLDVGSTTTSGSISTGSIVTAGGVGIAKTLYVGETGNFAGNLTAAATTQSTTALTGAFVCSGGVGIAKDLFTLGSINEITANGAVMSIGSVSEEITLGVGATNHDSVANLLPANSLILAVTGRVTTALSGGTKAVGTITMSGVATADETFVIGSQTFTWKALRAGAGEVTIGAGAAEAVTNIVAAITADIPTIATAADGAGDTVVVTAVDGGVAGNAIIFTEASTNMAVDGAGTLGGTTPGVDIATWTLADTATATRFAAANSTISTSGNSIGLNHWKGGVASDAAGPTQTAAAKVRITTNVIPSGGGKIRVTVYYATFTAPTS